MGISTLRPAAMKTSTVMTVSAVDLFSKIDADVINMRNPSLAIYPRLPRLSKIGVKGKYGVYGQGWERRRKGPRRRSRIKRHSANGVNLRNRQIEQAY